MIEVERIFKYEDYIEAYIDYYNSKGGSWTYEQAKSRLGQIFLTPNFYGLGIYEKGNCLGFAIGWIKEFDDVGIYFLEEILIFEPYQKRGLGSRLMEELEDRLTEEGIYKITFITSLERGHQNFYGNLAYEKSDSMVYMSKIIK